MRRPLRGDDGQIAVFVLGCAVVAGLLVMTAGAATQVHLGRQQLQSLADAAALDGADSLDAQAYYTTGTAPGAGLPLSATTVREAASQELAATAQASWRLQDLRVADPTGSPDARTAQVTLAARVRPWLLPKALASLPPTIDVSVTSRARAGLVLP